MSGTTNRQTKPSDAEGGSFTCDQLATLRRLLLGAEKEQLDKIQLRLDDPEQRAHDVARVLAKAHRIRNRQDDELGDALGPTISEAFDTTIKKDPEKLADAIAPIMGPAIRPSIMQTIRGMIQSLNRTFEQSLSWQGLKWRIEARRTGKSFGEVVLLHTLVYQVEQVFLIQPESGLLMQHVARDDARVKDTDMVSGMLTAIQDFVKDSFGGDAGDELRTMHVGEQTVWVENGPHAALAVVIRGEAPESLRSTARKTLERVHMENREVLATFDGDTSLLDNASYELEQCLQAKFREEEKDEAAEPDEKEKSRTKIYVNLGVAGALILALLTYFVITGLQRNSQRRERMGRWNAFVQMLADEPGIVVTNAEAGDDQYLVSGLKDPLARAPASFLESAGIDPGQVTFQWKAYQAGEAVFVLARTRQFLDPPDSVELKLVDGTLYISGTAPESWAKDIARFARMIAGVRQVNLNGLVATGT